jgi:hypothetical protein
MVFKVKAETNFFKLPSEQIKKAVKTVKIEIKWQT